MVSMLVTKGMLTSVLITHVEHNLSGSVLQAFHDGTTRTMFHIIWSMAASISLEG
jgi:hypothetical protein